MPDERQPSYPLPPASEIVTELGDAVVDKHGYVWRKPGYEPPERPKPTLAKPPMPVECEEPFPDPPADGSNPTAQFSWLADLIHRLSIAWDWEVRQIEFDSTDSYLPSSLPSVVKEGLARFFPIAADFVNREGNTLGWSEAKRRELANLLRTSADQAGATRSDDDESTEIDYRVGVDTCEVDIESLRQLRYELLNAVARGVSNRSGTRNRESPNRDPEASGAAPELVGETVEQLKQAQKRPDPARESRATEETENADGLAPARQPQGNGSEAGEQLPGRRTRVDAAAALSAESRGLAVLVQHPDWDTTKIAKEAGVHRSSLYRSQVFMKAREAAREAGVAGKKRVQGQHGKSDRRQGRKGKPVGD